MIRELLPDGLRRKSGKPYHEHMPQPEDSNTKAVHSGESCIQKATTQRHRTFETHDTQRTGEPQCPSALPFPHHPTARLNPPSVSLDDSSPLSHQHTFTGRSLQDNWHLRSDCMARLHNSTPVMRGRPDHRSRLWCPLHHRSGHDRHQRFHELQHFHSPH